MRKKKAFKNLSNEIFDDEKKENSHDIFADKDNLVIEDTESTPKLEEEHNIELGEINNILQDNLNGKEEEEVVENDSLLDKPKDDIIVSDDKDNNILNDEKQEVEVKDEEIINDEELNQELEYNDVIENDEYDLISLNQLNEKIEDSDIEEENDLISLNDLNEKISEEIEEDKTSLNDLNNELEEKEIGDLTDQMQKDAQIEIVMPDIDEDIEISDNDNGEEDTFADFDDNIDDEDDTTFNELNDRTDKNDVQEEQIVSSFPKIDKFGIVVPNKKE